MHMHMYMLHVHVDMVSQRPGGKAVVGVVALPVTTYRAPRAGEAVYFKSV